MATRTATRRSTKALRPKRKPSLTSAETTAALKGYDEKYLECRDTRHWWKTVGIFRNAEGYRIRVLKCRRGCTVEAKDTLGANGERIKPRSYKYPDEYKIGQLDPMELRVEVMRRTTIYSSEAKMLAAITRKR